MLATLDLDRLVRGVRERAAVHHFQRISGRASGLDENDLVLVQRDGLAVVAEKLEKNEHLARTFVADLASLLDGRVGSLGISHCNVCSPRGLSW